MDTTRRIILSLACACALAVTLVLAAGPAGPGSAGGGVALGPAEAAAAETSGAASAQTAPRRFRVGYESWRKRLRRHGVYVGRDLHPQVRTAEGGVRAPTKRELRRSIHRMQRRWDRWLQTSARGRAVAFKLKVRRKVPRWGKQYLRNIAWCESRGNPRAVGGGGIYRGMYQFSVRTWYVVGGTGDPAAAPRFEQTWRAWLLLSRHGSQHWPVCG
jgi:transglycosylase-like protein